MVLKEQEIAVETREKIKSILQDMPKLRELVRKVNSDNFRLLTEYEQHASELALEKKKCEVHRQKGNLHMEHNEALTKSWSEEFSNPQCNKHEMNRLTQEIIDLRKAFAINNETITQVKTSIQEIERKLHLNKAQQQENMFISKTIQEEMDSNTYLQ